MKRSTDHIVRTISDGGAFRLVAVVSTSTVAGVCEAQNPPNAEVASLLGEVVTSAVLIREMMAADRRVQVTLKDPARGSLFADSHPDGLTRGLLQMRSERTPELGAETLFQVIRVLENTELQQGLVDTAHDRGIAASLTNYMRTSEQVQTVCDLATLVSDDGRVVRSAGFMLQLLPDADASELEAVTERVESLPRLHDWLEKQSALEAAQLAEFVFGPLRHRTLANSEVWFGCNCSHERVIAALGSLDVAELSDAVASGERLATDCDYCATHYDIDPAEVLRKMRS
jgi:molecular chaperone Hsp33